MTQPLQARMGKSKKLNGKPQGNSALTHNYIRLENPAGETEDRAQQRLSIPGRPMSTHRWMGWGSGRLPSPAGAPPLAPGEWSSPVFQVYLLLSLAE